MTRPRLPPTAAPDRLPDADDRLLGGLPVHDVGPERAEQIRQRAHVLLRQAGRPATRRGPGWALAYHRFLEPAVLIGLGLWQLAWTVQDTLALFH